MTKTKYIIIFIIFLFALVGCNKKDDKIEEKLTKFMDEVFKEERIKPGIELPEYYNDGEKDIPISWQSDDNKIPLDGRHHYFPVDRKVKITARFDLDKENISITKEVTFKGQKTWDEYKKEIDKLIPNEIAKDTTFISEETEVFYTKNQKATIKYESTNLDILGSDGKYNTQSKQNEEVRLNYIVTIAGCDYKGYKVVTVLARNDGAKIDNAITWLENNWYQKVISEDLSLPSIDDKGFVTITWKSLNKEFIDDRGEILEYEINKKFKMEATLKMNDTTKTEEFEFNTLQQKDALEYIINRMNKSKVIQYYHNTAMFPNDYGRLPFYTRDISEKELIVQEPTELNYQYGTKDNNANVTKKSISYAMAPLALTVKRPHRLQPKVEFIVIHDTGSTDVDAKGWGNHIINNKTREASWHFTVDDKIINQHMPLDEIAYHAGCGASKSREYKLHDTGVKYTVHKPEITVDVNTGKMVINGEQSLINIPVHTGSDEPKYSGKYPTKISDAGLITVLGSNGNYYMDTIYYNRSYNRIASLGGNTNGIGIETCINTGVRYSEVQRTTANLVAHLLKMYDLDISSITQHRHFSGKECPRQMIRIGNFHEFVELIEIEHFILKYLPDLKISYESLSKDMLDNDGNLLKFAIKDTKVEYKVRAESNGVKYEETFNTIITIKK